jgi:spore germination cell wall hydrolase CwlJ-like protein
MIIELFIAGHLFTSAMLHGPPVVLRENIVANNNEYRCLLRAVWHESRGETFEGKLWTAKTILNRTRSEKFPHSVCRVVYQSKQFSFTHQLPRSKQLVRPKTAIEKQTFKEVELASFISIWSDRLGIDFTNNSKWYHTTTSKPVWRHKLKVTKVVGNHIFYKQRREI